MNTEYIVSHPAGAIVNGTHRDRGTVLTGADAEAVSKSRILQHRCTRNRRPSAPAPAPAAPPRSSSSPSGASEE